MQNEGLLDFVSFLNELYLKGEVCVFYELHGHVDYFSYSVRYSKDNYADTLIEDEIKLSKYYYNDDPNWYKGKVFKNRLARHK
ncbi:MAG: hypothetical protein ACRDFB_03060, partial [Rhabdochlamydiaceae bacterium]